MMPLKYKHPYRLSHSMPITLDTYSHKNCKKRYFLHYKGNAKMLTEIQPQLHIYIYTKANKHKIV